MNQLHLPEGINYDCTGCGKCCSGWTVPMTEADYKRVSSVDWPEIKEKSGMTKLFGPLKEHEKKGTPYSYRILSEEGTCPFLVNNLCHIHAQRGSEFKPAICQQFPYNFIETPTGIYASVSFVSMAVLYNTGTPLTEQRAYMERKWADFQKLYPDHKPDWSAIKLTVGQPITWDEYMKLESEMQSILADRSVKIEERLLKCSQLLVSKVQGSAASTRTGIDSTIPGAPTLKPLDVSLLMLFHKMYFPTKPLKRGEVDFSTMRLIKQHLWGTKRLQLMDRSFSIEELHHMPWPHEDAEISGILDRYMYQSIFGKRYFGAGFGQVSVISGFHHLIMMIVLIKLQSKASALQRGTKSVNILDVVTTVKQLERQVGESKLSGYSAAGWELMLYPPGRAARLLANS